jgi:predicted DNA-binding transcriptional regulator AlpA
MLRDPRGADDFPKEFKLNHGKVGWISLKEL